MDRDDCFLYEDLFLLYREGKLSEQTKKAVQEHLSGCDACRALYKEDFALHFTNRLEPPGEKRFIRKLKKIFAAAVAVVVALLVGSTALAYIAGDWAGKIGERFRLAQENELFIEVNQQADFGGVAIILEEVLLDSTATSVVFKTDVDLSRVDSITMEDDKGKYYTKTHTLLSGQPLSYEWKDGYTVVNFEPVAPGAAAIEITLNEWKAGGEEIADTVQFTIPIEASKIQKSISESRNVLKEQIGDIVFSVDQLIQSVSQTDMICRFDLESSKYDGVSLGWTYTESLDSRKNFIVYDPLGETFSVLSAQDITEEIRMDDPVLKKTWGYKLICNPVPEGTENLKIKLSNLYGYYSLQNQELRLKLTAGEKTDINRKFEGGGLVVEILSAQEKNGLMIIQYSVRDSEGNIRKDILLDARIRPTGDAYAVPAEGTVQCGDTVNNISFQADPSGDYVVTLARLGEKASPLEFEIELKQ